MILPLLFGLGVAVALFFAMRAAQDGTGQAARSALPMLFQLGGILLALVFGLLSLLGTAWILLAAHFARKEGAPLDMLALLYLPLIGLSLMVFGIRLFRRGRRLARAAAMKAR